MIQIPKIPPKEELEYKEKEFLLSLYEQVQSSSKVWFFVLLGAVLLAWPAKILLQKQLTQFLISSYRPPPVNERPYLPQALKVFRTNILATTPGSFSVYTQVSNPNADIAVRNFDYQFVFKDAQNQILTKVPGASYLLAGESKFLLLPTVNLSSVPATVELVLEKIRWTKVVPPFDVLLEILQKSTGLTSEGNFFAEASVKNLQDFGIREVEVGVVVFDRTNQNVLAVNTTVLNDLKPLENRYFKVTWPKSLPAEGLLGAAPLGQVQITASVNPFTPGLLLTEPEKIPAR